MKPPPMRIATVARCLNTDHVRGMGKYLFELLRQSQGERRIDWQLYADDPRLPLLHPNGPGISADCFAFRGDRFRLWEQLGLPQRVRRSGADLLFCTEGCLPIWQPLPTVVTLHDTLAFEERPNEGFQRFYWDLLVPAALRRSAHVITISQSSQRDILARWPELEPKLSVILHGIDADYFSEETPPLPQCLAENLGTSRYLVYLGGPMARKRFDWALKVLQAQDDSTLRLVACGFGNAARQAAAAQLGPGLKERVTFAPFLSDGELRRLYRGALAVVYPTLYEGFGFPAIEAQASGVPVLMSPLGSLQELMGPLAMNVPAYELQAWVEALRILNERSADERRARANEARQWARQFDWQSSYQSHRAVFEQVLAKHRQEL
jgi:glycosyltransferase involved in cell wall biosynthesis